MTAVPADLRRERHNPDNSVDMLQLALDALREYERNAFSDDDVDLFCQRDLAELRFQLASTIEIRRVANALERIADAMIPEVQP